MQGEIPVAHIKKAIRDMQGVYRVLRDPGGWKRKLFRLLDNPYFPLGHLHTNIYPKIETQTTSGVGSTAFLDDVQDFLPVYRTALMRTLELWEAVDGYLRGIISKEQLGQLLGNKSFTTGEEVPDPIT